MAQGLQQRWACQAGCDHQPVAAAGACLGVDHPPPICVLAAPLQLQHSRRLGAQAVALAIVQEGLHHWLRVELTVVRGEERSGGFSGKGRAERLQFRLAKQPQRQTLLLALFDQAGLGLPVLLVAGQLQQASSPGDLISALGQLLSPLLPQRQ